MVVKTRVRFSFLDTCNNTWTLIYNPLYDGPLKWLKHTVEIQINKGEWLELYTATPKRYKEYLEDLDWSKVKISFLNGTE